ncbi:hypothetical protein GQ44DRAFT_699821 [Phaeosphaeriaceae sp. PMI808]|nr:hypothetical protein GQ44DRAFT_699821 [Phaeosphaeriaceae sp. PMI808]
MADNKQRFDIVNGKQVALLVAPVLAFLLASGAVAARWYTRSVRRVNTLIEDGLCLVALAMSFGVVTLVYILVFLCGEGMSPEEINRDGKRDLEEVMRSWLRMQFALDICWATSVAFVQLAYVKFYSRLYEGQTLARGICYFSMGIIGIWYVWTIAWWITMCHPPGKCELQAKKSCIIIGSLHVFFNTVILLGPVPAIYSAQLGKNKKVSFLVLFLLGCFCVALAVLRMDCAFEVFGNIHIDPIGASWWRICFSPIEIAVGIICCCLPNVNQPNFWRRERPALPTESTGLRRLKFRSTSGSSSTSNLHPAHWRFDLPKPQVNTFVTLENGSKSVERISSLGPHEIKVTKDYQMNRDRL